MSWRYAIKIVQYKRNRITFQQNNELNPKELSLKLHITVSIQLNL